MNSLLQSIQKTSVPYGTAVMWWLGQMGLIVKMNHTILCVDYFASEYPDRQVPPLIPMEEMTGIDAFLGSHNHDDHIDHNAWQTFARKCPEAKFVFPAPHLKSVLADGVAEENCRGISEGDVIRIGDVTIRCIAAAHEFLDRDPDTLFYPYLQYIIEGNGLRIYHAGDTLRYEGMLQKLTAFGPIDAALLPINGRDGKRYRRNCIGNMTFQEAADLAGELRPGLVIPGHFDMFADNSADPHEFADYLDAKYQGQVSCLIPQYAVPVRVTAPDPS